jgi:hypothetical protein
VEDGGGGSALEYKSVFVSYRYFQASVESSRS